MLITGANSGVGYAAAVELARHGAMVLLACRDEARGKAALARLKSDAKGKESRADEAELVLLDLASLDSVRAVAGMLIARHDPLHVLVNNAGVMAPPERRQTKDGFELQFGTNVLGHFALTCALMPLLEMARSAALVDAPRVVTLASIAHKRGVLNFDDLNAEKSYSPRAAYSQSKLADLMFAFELERQLRKRTMGAVSIAVHPGVARTNIVKFGNSQGGARVAEQLVSTVIGVLLNSDLGGAIPTLYAATAPDAQGGGYYGSQGLMETRGGDVGLAQVAPQARDEAAQQRLWDVCERLTGFHL
jgi:NAD(P)-dependent dehydrogenase (short-subunit alcohol dehydrogenase family)